VNFSQQSSDHAHGRRQFPRRAIIDTTQLRAEPLKLGAHRPVVFQQCPTQRTAFGATRPLDNSAQSFDGASSRLGGELWRGLSKQYFSEF
jgi:hypothetical protein